MMKKVGKQVREKAFVFLALSLCSVFLMTGCGSNDTSQEQNGEEAEVHSEADDVQALLYENSEAGFRVYETSNWEFKKETGNESVNVTFENDQAKAIITVVSTNKQLEEIKKELKTALKKSTIIEETEHYLAFQSDRKESIRSDIYIDQRENGTSIITFMVPAEDFDANQEKMEELKRHIEWF
ncbi:hypothetical protein [Alkalihalobacillus sp. BA299]|uniref:hypothetical protein n=1 Tax=Alkalihalobacillus sp. BA299 TaxID=2815938 RepID=UPI001ADBD500|nr:hypothetical protein [Alkalihalobacillus sp. BA299]